ncbi:MAG TPA: zinc dependent phospholipase C family protein [Cyclobacteriaceae bacterium]
MTTPLKRLILPIMGFFCMSFAWGFFAHQRINRLAVFTLPPKMLGFYKKNIAYVTEAAVNPDKRRYAIEGEAQRHYIDLDHYGDSALNRLPRYWESAVDRFTEDTLQAYGILPWHIYRTYYQLKDAFLVRDPEKILRISADIGHYIADAHVPLHTTQNYDGQLSGQTGIHAFWESRLPELFAGGYNFFVGKASYLDNPQLAAWKAVASAHHALDSVLGNEKALSLRAKGKYSFETKGRQTQRVYSREYAEAYHDLLAGMVERQMRRAIRLTGDFWFTAWVDAGQPDLNSLIGYVPTAEELRKRREELRRWREKSEESSVPDHHEG